MRLERRYAACSELATELAEAIADHLRDTIDSQGAASLVVPGADSPPRLLAALANESLPWERVTVTLTDECWVAADDEASHEGRVRSALLVGEAEPARFVGLKTGAATPEEARLEVEARLAELQPFDVVVTGMGRSGHVASLYPDAPEIGAGVDLESDRRCLALRPAGTSHPRLSLSMAALLYSRQRYLVFTGEEKWSVYRRALEEGPLEELPVRGLVLPTSRALEVHWAP